MRPVKIDVMIPPKPTPDVQLANPDQKGLSSLKNAMASEGVKPKALFGLQPNEPSSPAPKAEA